MNIAIDISPLDDSGKGKLHRVRGTGFYIQNLKEALLSGYPSHSYSFFTKNDQIPSTANVVHYPYFEPFFLTLPTRSIFKTVVTVHDLTPMVFPKAFPSGIKGKIKWYIQKCRLSAADAVITDSQASKKDIVKFTSIPEERIHVVYLAPHSLYRKVSPEDTFDEVRKKYDLPEKFALYVGDVTPNKNLPRLVEAVNKANIPLVMVGNALVKKDYDRLNSLNKDLIKIQEMISSTSSIYCLGFVPTEELVFIYNMAAVFVMPSLYEGFGLPLLEAMACGCPVITSDTGSIKEVVSEAAYFVDPHKTESIAEGIAEVFENKELQKELISKGETNMKRFSWKKTAGETLEVYKSVLK